MSLEAIARILLSKSYKILKGQIPSIKKETIYLK